MFPGENEQEQLAMIISLIGVPSLHLLAQASRRKLFFGLFSSSSSSSRLDSHSLATLWFRFEKQCAESVVETEIDVSRSLSKSIVGRSSSNDRQELR